MLHRNNYFLVLVLTVLSSLFNLFSIRVCAIANLISSNFWPRFHIVVLGMIFFFIRSFTFHILFALLFPFSIWTFDLFSIFRSFFNLFIFFWSFFDHLIFFWSFDLFSIIWFFFRSFRLFSIFWSFFDLSNRGLILDFFQIFFVETCM